MGAKNGSFLKRSKKKSVYGGNIKPKDFEDNDPYE